MLYKIYDDESFKVLIMMPRINWDLLDEVKLGNASVRSCKLTCSVHRVQRDIFPLW